MMAFKSGTHDLSMILSGILLIVVFRMILALVHSKWHFYSISYSCVFITENTAPFKVPPFFSCILIAHHSDQKVQSNFNLLCTLCLWFETSADGSDHRHYWVHWSPVCVFWWAIYKHQQKEKKVSLTHGHRQK